MKTLITILGLATAGFSLPAMAQGGPPADPYGDATVTRADELTAIGARFDALDANKDGSLSADELAVGAPAGGRGGPGGGRGPGSRADADGDGKVSKDEYVTSQLRRFDSQDADKDGKLTKAERDSARERRGQGGPGGGGGWGGPPPGGEGGGWGSPDGQ